MSKKAISLSDVRPFYQVVVFANPSLREFNLKQQLGHAVAARLRKDSHFELMGAETDKKLQYVHVSTTMIYTHVLDRRENEKERRARWSFVAASYERHFSYSEMGAGLFQDLRAQLERAFQQRGRCRPPVAQTTRIHRISPIPNRPLPLRLEIAKSP